MGTGIRPGGARGTFRSQARVEFGLLLDLTVKGTGRELVFSAPKPFFFSCDQGRPAPKKKGELAGKFWENRYRMKLPSHEEKAGTHSSFSNSAIVGFVQSSEMWSQRNLGTA